MKMPRELTACALWVASLACMAFGSIDSGRVGHPSPVLAWGIFLAVVACVPTGWCILQRERGRATVEDPTVEHIIEVVDALHQGRTTVSRLH